MRTSIQLTLLVILAVGLTEPAIPAPAGAAPAVSQSSAGSVRPPTKTQSAAYDALLSKANAEGAVRVIVRLRDAFRPEGALSQTEAETQRDRTAQMQNEVLERLAGHAVTSLKRFRTVPYLAMKVDTKALETLTALEAVEQVAEDVPVPATLSESVPLIGADLARDLGYSGAGQAVAILDTGVAKTHPFLAGKVVAEGCFSTTDLASGVRSLCPNHLDVQTGSGAGVNCSGSIAGCQHGTHVAGIAAGKGADFSGVARDARIIAVQVFSRFDNPVACGGSPTCVLTFTSDQMQALEFVFRLRSQLRIAAVNMSLGGGFNATFCDSDPRKSLIDTLRSVGIATVIASGNNGFFNGISAPACISSSISVGATDKSDVVTVFSNSAPMLKLLAPGKDILSSVPGGFFQALDGTSMAAPHVAGAWAVLKSKKPAAGVNEVLSLLTRTGVPVTDSFNGLIRPRIQLDAAVQPGDIVAVDLNNNGRSDLLVDFGDASGIWVLWDRTQWSKLHSLTARHMVDADFNRDGRSDVVVDFGPANGLWAFMSNPSNPSSRVWVKLQTLSARHIVSDDFDGNGQSDLAADFGSTYGIRLNMNASGWGDAIDAGGVRHLATADFDDSGQADLVIDYGPSFGIWAYINGVSWVQIHPSTSRHVVRADFDGNGQSDLAVDFGAPYGIWVLQNRASWTKIHPTSARHITAADVDGNGRSDLLVDFGSGLWEFVNRSAWHKIHSLSARLVLDADFDNNGRSDPVVDFGSPYGIWTLINNGAWNRIHTLSARP